MSDDAFGKRDVFDVDRLADSQPAHVDAD